MKLILVLSQLVIILLSACTKDNNSTYKDFQISVLGTDYAEIKILNYSDSSFVTKVIYDANEVGYTSEGYNALHLSTISSGKYIVSGYCPYKNLKHNTVSQIINYSGTQTSVTLEFY